ncbi:hypothetical protein GGS23DRAFT_236456 [Durotheca rogersii]|uniref:uncharacterized protein n=1 Tax=Durotheca rogersii TaxID=419775 RepID=UPI00221F2F6E|nr:uncharacterized protein GGS23DRAFT_236456 [Durotheca rogersii]KAI5860423.1 hypothetical protein GGS23DRAFT_236456 [Durotheca rogersii]
MDAHLASPLAGCAGVRHPRPEREEGLLAWREPRALGLNWHTGDIRAHTHTRVGCHGASCLHPTVYAHHTTPLPAHMTTIHCARSDRQKGGRHEGKIRIESILQPSTERATRGFYIVIHPAMPNSNMRADDFTSSPQGGVSTTLHTHALVHQISTHVLRYACSLCLRRTGGGTRCSGSPQVPSRNRSHFMWPRVGKKAWLKLGRPPPPHPARVSRRIGE